MRTVNHYWIFKYILKDIEVTVVLYILIVVLLCRSSCVHVFINVSVDCVYTYLHTYFSLFLYSGLWETVFGSLCLYTQTERWTIKLTLT